MEAIKLNTIIKNDGEINLTGIPCKKGEKIELIILIESSSKTAGNEVLNLMPKHKMGSGNSNFNRDCIYDDER